VVHVVWTQSAEDDLQDIFEYVGDRSPRGARTVVEEFINAATQLRRFPLLGECLHDYPDRDYRQFVVRNYRLLYRYEEEAGRLVILRLLHASRDLGRAIGDDNE